MNSDEEAPETIATSAIGLPIQRIHGRAEKALQQTLLSGEAVLCQVTGMARSQALVLTDQRAIIIKVGFRAGQTLGGKTTSFEYRNITNVEVRTGMMTGVFQLGMAGMPAQESGYWSKGQGDAWKTPNALPIAKKQVADFQKVASIVRERMTAAHAPTSATAAVTPPDPMQQLRHLGELRDAGVLSTEEFETKKQEILRRV